MNKLTNNFLIGGAALLMALSIGAAGQTSAQAAIHANQYGVDVFPSRKNHYRFAYQLRKRGHGGRVYYANRNSKLGRALFSHGQPKSDYANYMIQHHAKWLRSINQRMYRTASKPNRKARRYTQYKNKAQRRRAKKTVRRARRQAKKSSSRSAKVLPSKFTRSNSSKALKKSGFFDLRPFGGHFIFNKYAPNDRRATIPKKLKVTNWAQGYFGRKNPPVYTYVAKQHGWKPLKK